MARLEVAPLKVGRSLRQESAGRVHVGGERVTSRELIFFELRREIRTFKIKPLLVNTYLIMSL